MQLFYSCLFLLLANSLVGQALSGSELLDKAIAYHDPEGKWPTFSADLIVTMSMPDKPERTSDMTINLPAEFYQLRTSDDGVRIVRTLEKDSCQYTLDGSSSISADDLQKYKLSCERSKLWRNYYTYLFGLPMKLKDPGTLIDPSTTRKEFKGKEYLVLKATYEELWERIYGISILILQLLPWKSINSSR